MDYSEFYKSVYSQDANFEGEANGWIQWKGTSVCMDVHCVCGEHSHIDEEFFYHFRCPRCKAAYAVGQSVKLIPLTKEQELFVDKDHVPFKPEMEE